MFFKFYCSRINAAPFYTSFENYDALIAVCLKPKLAGCIFGKTETNAKI